MAETQTGRLSKLGAKHSQSAGQGDTASRDGYRCQWCMVDLEPGVNVCPTCGSPGVDSSMKVPGAEVAVKRSKPNVAPRSENELEEWWNDEAEKAYRNTAEDEQSQTPVIIGLLGTAVICIAIGVIFAPMVLANAFESSLGVTVENSNDLRPLGGLLGLLVGAFIGALGMWVTAPRR